MSVVGSNGKIVPNMRRAVSFSFLFSYWFATVAFLVICASLFTTVEAKKLASKGKKVGFGGVLKNTSSQNDRHFAATKNAAVALARALVPYLLRCFKTPEFFVAVAQVYLDNCLR